MILIIIISLNKWILRCRSEHYRHLVVNLTIIICDLKITWWMNRVEKTRLSCLVSLSFSLLKVLYDSQSWFRINSHRERERERVVGVTCHHNYYYYSYYYTVVRFWTTKIFISSERERERFLLLSFWNVDRRLLLLTWDVHFVTSFDTSLYIYIYSESACIRFIFFFSGTKWIAQLFNYITNCVIRVGRAINSELI